MELKNKSIIITGASSGIGAAAALLFAAEGANVVLGARRAAELETLAGAINRGNGRALYLAGDVRMRATPRLWSVSPRKSSAGWTALSTMPASWERWVRSPI